MELRSDDNAPLPPENRESRPDLPSATRERIASWLWDSTVRPDPLLHRLHELRELEGLPACSQAVHLLTHLNLPEAEAERLLRELLGHREAMRRGLGRDPGLVVAALDFLTGDRPLLRRPLIREMSGLEGGERSALTDPLTDLARRRGFDGTLSSELRRSRRHAREFALVLIDLDHFRTVNEVYGRPVGDRVLRRAGQLVRRSVRCSDSAARFGGEEFAVILPETERSGAHAAMERVRRAVHAHFTEVPFDGRLVTMTVSAGAACFPADGETSAQLVAGAEKAVTRAKAAGRNHSVAHPAERRREVRYPLRGAVRVVLSRASGEQSPARLLDVSRSGALLESRAEPGAAGATLALGFEGSPVGSRPAARVVRVDAGSTAGSWRVAVAVQPALDEARVRALSARGRSRLRLAGGLRDHP